MRISQNVKISDLTTMKIGGLASFLIEIEKEEDLQSAREFVKEKKLPYFFLGSGANLIGKDEGFDGCLIKNCMRGINKIEDKDCKDILTLKAAGGEIWDDLSRYASDLGFSGIEAMAKIPGTVGAAPVQNIGAYGQELKNVIISADVYDFEDGISKNFKKNEMGFEYRKSIFNFGKDKGRYFITNIYIQLEKKQLKPPFYTSLQKYIEDNDITDFSPKNIYKIVTKIRAEKIPDPKEIPSAGSFFKNIILNEQEAMAAKKGGVQVWKIEEKAIGVCKDESKSSDQNQNKNSNAKYKVNSGWLLEDAGLKGKVFHGFRINEKAALILLNENGKTYKDLEMAKDEIAGIVRERYGFELEMEPVKIGEK